ncbi:GAF domain-containing protein [Phenylobacterium sp. LjRoot164]|uniref:GAF domain-containing protein n=1 Tax=unclassified Phenylobacterium TaxID=2640670 RepID=UPI003ED0972F
MKTPLASIRDCFEGVIPSVIATLDAAGQPNVSYLSQVYLVDAEHVALSNQFFSKTAANVAATGRAHVLVVSGRTGAQFALDVEHRASLAEGPVFDKMSAQLTAISSQHGVGDAMVLRSAELYWVSECRAILGPPMLAETVPSPTAQDRLALAARVAAAIAAQADAEAMVDAALDGLVAAFGFANAMLLMLDDHDGRLATLASRGYAQGGAGSEVALGEGAIGIAAASGQAIRLSDMSRGRRMAAAVTAGAALGIERSVPLPGLDEPQSQLAAPMVSRGKVHGVLFAESSQRFWFGPDDEEALMLIGGQLAASLRLAELEAREAEAATTRHEPAGAEGEIRVKYFAHDDSLFLDDAYLIKGVPGRLLFHLLTVFADTGRRDFTNREIRLEASLRLPGLKDNLETRLILLRRRLEEKGAPIRLARPGRGQIRLELDGVPRLETAPPV